MVHQAKLFRMSINDVLSTIDSEIARLEHARALLTGVGAKTRTKKSAVEVAERAKRTLSPEARKRIADAQRKRWAAQKKTEK